MKKISTSLLTTIIAVGVAVALVVAMFVPTIITLTKNNKEVDALDAQIAELKEQLEALKGADTLTDEDVAAAISDALAKLEIPEAGLSEEQVKAIVDAAIGALVIPDAGLSEAQVKAIVDAAIAALVIPEAGLSKEEVEKIVADAIKGVDTGLTEAEINKLIADAIAKIEIPEAGLTAEEINKLIADAIAKIEIPEAGLTVEEANKLIADAIAKIEIPEAGLSEAQVKAIVDAAIAALDIPAPGLTEAEVEAIVKEILDEQAGSQPNPEDLTLSENITLGNSVTLKEDTVLADIVTHPINGESVIDLGGKTLVLDKYTLIEVCGDLTIKNGKIIVKSAAAFGIAVRYTGTFSLENIELTLTETGACAVTNAGTTAFSGCTFVIADTTDAFNCIFYNEGNAVILNSSFKEAGATDISYVYDAPIRNSGTIDMVNVSIVSSDFCTSTDGGVINADASSSFTITGEKQLTPDGDYFAYNVYRDGTPSSNNCAEFKYLGKAEVNQANVDFKNVFANGGTINLTNDVLLGSQFALLGGNEVVIDLGGKTLTLNENAFFNLANGSVIIKNGKIIANTDSDDTLYCFFVSAASTLKLEGVEFTNCANADGIYNEGNLIVNDSKLITAANGGGVSGSVIYNYKSELGGLAVATITNSVIDNTAAISAEYYPITTIINYGIMTLDKTTVNSNTSCIYAGSYEAKTTIIDGAMNHGTGDKCAVMYAESASFLFGTVVDVTWTVDGAAKEVSVYYAKYSA